MDRFEAMSMLLRVVEAGSLSAASRAMLVPLPTLSRKLSELETRLGTRLLVRTTRRLSLTDAGAAYVVAARRILEQVEEAEREAAGEFTAPKGELVVTAPLLFGQLHVLPVIADFLALFPDINVRLVQSDRNVDLIDDHIDMAVRIGRLADSSMIATRIGGMRMVVCASPALIAAYGAPLSPNDLSGRPSIDFTGPTPHPIWQFQEPGTGGALAVSMRPRLIVTTAAAARDAALRGVGFARLLHYQVADEVREGRLRIVLEGYEFPPSPVSLLHAAHSQMPLKMRRFLDFATPRLRRALTAIGAGAPG